MLNSNSMKSWTAGQMFFVFDTEYCQNEEDDPKDAILYFYPLETTDTMRCTLCCQLMGICNFMKSCFSPVSLIRLGKGKFAVRSIQKYTLAIRGTVDMPDSVLQRQMDSLIELFQFHHCNFETVWNSCQGSRKRFLEKMTETWNVLLPISQHAGNTLSLTFDLVPSVDLPKTGGLLFLQASQLLQACQRYEGILAGCLLCDQRVLYTQLSTTVMHKLAFIRHNQRLPGEPVPVVYTLPGSVSLAYVYVDADELLELRAAKRVAVAPTIADAINASLRLGNVAHLVNGHAHTDFTRTNCVDHSTSEVSVTPTDVIRPPNATLSSSFSPNSVQPTVSPQDSQPSSPVPQPHSTPDLRSDRPNSDQESVANERPSVQSLGSSVDESSNSEVASSYESCPEFAEDSGRSLSSPAIADPTPVERGFIGGDGNTSLDPSDTTLLEVTVVRDECAENGEVARARETDTGKQTSIESSGSGGQRRGAAIRSTVIMEDTEPLVLYVQQVNGTVLMLFLRDERVASSDVINSLWQLGVDSMTNLESDVKSCQEMAPKKNIKSGSKYLYLQHDTNRKNNTGNVASENDGRFWQQVFNRSVHLLHEDFMSDQNLYETTICSQNHIVYGHRLGSRETYFQQQQHSTTTHESSQSSSSAGGGSSGSGGGEQGFPLQSDAVTSVAAKAKRRLERDQGMVLL